MEDLFIKKKLGKGDAVLPFVAKQMELESMVLNEIRLTKISAACSLSHEPQSGHGVVRWGR